MFMRLFFIPKNIPSLALKLNYQKMLYILFLTYLYDSTNQTQNYEQNS